MRPVKKVPEAPESGTEISPKILHFTMRVNAEDLEGFHALAWKRRVPLSVLIRRLLEEERIKDAG